MLLAGMLALGITATLARDARTQAQPRTLRALYGLTPPAHWRACRTALLLVDFQDEFVHGRLRLPDVGPAIARASELLAWARRSGVLVVAVRNVAARPDSPVFAQGSPTSAFVPALEPRAGELSIVKSIAGAFSRTDLDTTLRARDIDTLIVAGLMTHLAVLATASDATVLGYHTVVAGDATATRALPEAGGEDTVAPGTLQRAALASIADRAADVMPVQQIMALPVVQGERR